MTINKLTSNVKPLDEVDKINETISLLNGESTITNSVITNADESIKLETSSGNAYVATAKRMDTNNKVSFGIGSGGESRGIYDAKLAKWAFHVSDGKAYALGNEIAVKSELHALKSYIDEGELLTDEEGLTDVKVYAHSTFDKSKFTVVGSPTISSDGIASGFSSGNYIYANVGAINSGVLKFRTSLTFLSSAPSSNSCMLSITGSNDNRVIFDRTLNNQLEMLVYVDGDKKETVKFSTNPSGGHFDVEMTVDYNRTISTVDLYQGVELIESKEINFVPILDASTKAGFTGMGWLGAQDMVADLKYFSVTIDRVPVFSGNKTGIDTIKADYIVAGSPVISDVGVASGFSSSNYLTCDTDITSASKNVKIIIQIKCTELQSSSSLSNGVFLAGTLSNHPIQLNRYSGKIGMYKNSWSYGVSEYSVGDIIDVKFTYNGTTACVYSKLATSDVWVQELNYTTNVSPIGGTIYLGRNVSATSEFVYGSINLNSFKIYKDGSLVCQPCLKIPYTKSKSGSKIVDNFYRNRVNDMAELFGYAPYFTLSDTDYTLPQGELYGLINKKVESDRLMPDFKNKITSNSTSCTVPAKGWVYVNAAYSTLTVSINGTVQLKTAANANTYNAMVTVPFLVEQGDIISIDNTIGTTYIQPVFCFYPLKGGF